MPDHSGHRERMRDKYLRFGPGVMSDAELAEIALYSVLPRSDVRPLAEELINNHGGFPGLAEMTRDELVEISGVGDEVALYIETIAALAARAESERRVGAVVRNVDSAKRYLRSKFKGIDREAVIELCISPENRVLNCVPIHFGPLSADNLNIRQFVTPALKARTDTVVIAHNKPSFRGTLEDLEMGVIRSLKSTLKRVDINILDYLIFFNEQCISAVAAHIIPGVDGRSDFSASARPLTAISEKQVKIRTLYDDDDD